MSDHSSKILCGRYNDLLKGLDIGLMCDFFVQKNLLTSQEVQTVLAEGTNHKRELAKVLTTRGTKKFTDITTLIRQFKAANASETKLVATERKGEVEPTIRVKPQVLVKMEPFTVLFFTFISQLASFFTGGRKPSWLTDDVPLEALSDFFPPGATKVASQKNVPIRMSVLLEAYQQLTGKDADDLEVQNLRKLYEKSEERCKQLVVVTQQWALECGDKDKALVIYETEVKQLKEVISQLDKRVGKYKRFWQDNRSSEQFEEIRAELTQRRALYDQVHEEKERAVKRVDQLSQENKRLASMIDTLKDHLAEAEDRLGNMKLQATVKEPTVREMSKVVSELRESQTLNQQLLDEKKQLEDQVMALQMALDDYQAVDQPPPPVQPPRPVPAPRAQPAVRTQAMVTGFRPRQYPQVDRDRNILGHNPPTRVVVDDDDTDSTSSEETLPSSEYQLLELKSMDVDLQPKSGEYASDEIQVGLPDGDYTRGTRYPNHSTIKVAPLEDEPPRCGAVGREKVCPSCHQPFVTLSEREFQTHVAGCFK